MSIAIGGFSATVSAGLRGFVQYSLAQNPSPIVWTEARLGALVASFQDGKDLRASYGQTFAVPRTPGPYSLTVYARDANGCENVTTTVRTVTVN